GILLSHGGLPARKSSCATAGSRPGNPPEPHHVGGGGFRTLAARLHVPPPHSAAYHPAAPRVTASPAPRAAAQLHVPPRTAQRHHVPPPHSAAYRPAASRAAARRLHTLAVASGDCRRPPSVAS